MKRTLLIVLPLLAIAVVTIVVLNFPVAFRLQSASPSGNSHVVGLRFQSQKAHELDGTLRLVVTHNQKQTKQQTSIPWGRDLAIKWNESKEVEAFVVEKRGRALIEFQIQDSALKCLKGSEKLATDPYKQEPQSKP